MGWLTKKQAQEQAELFEHHLKRYGVPVIMRLQPGSGNSRYWGHDWFELPMAHHIASRRSWGLTPGLGIVTRGRGGAQPLPGPLCNGYGGFDEKARLITMGLANHPGAGGPITLKGVHVPQDQGRYGLFGWEFEGGYDTSDWPASMHEFMGACLAATQDAISELQGITLTSEHVLDHKHWARPKGRKHDRLGYTYEGAVYWINQARSRVSGLTHIPEEDEMSEKDVQQINAHVDAQVARIMEGIGKAHTDASKARTHSNRAKIAGGRNELRLEQVLRSLGEPTIDADQLAKDLAELLADDIRDSIAEALQEQPDADADEVADLVVGKVAGKLAAPDETEEDDA